MTVGVIGYKGRVAKRHIKAWEELGIKWVGCDSSMDYKAFLTDEKLDIIDICTPIYLHAQMIKQAVLWGYPVICEKPIAMDVKEAEEIIQLGGQVGIIYQFRFNPKILQLKKDVREGKYGEIKLVTAQYYRWRGWEYYKNWEKDIFRSGGGTVFNVCIHYLDLLQWIFGYPYLIQSMTTTMKPGIDVEDTAVINMEFPTGAIGNVILSTHVNPPKHFELSIYGTKGHKTIQLRHNEYHKENFLAFLNDSDYVTPREAVKSLSIALDVIK